MYLQDYVLDTSHTSDPLQWQEKAKELSRQIAKGECGVLLYFCYVADSITIFLYLSGMRYLHWKAPYNPIILRDLHPLSGMS